MIGLAACCILNLWGAPGSHLLAFLHVQEGEKLRDQSWKLRCSCCSGDASPGQVPQVPVWDAEGAATKPSSEETQFRVQPGFNRMGYLHAQPPWKAFADTSVGGWAGTFPPLAPGNLSRKQSLMPTPPSCLFRAGCSRCCASIPS